MISTTRTLARSLTRLAAALPVLASLTVVGATARVGPAAAGCADAATVHHAALVVEHSDGASIRVCVAFGGASITGEALLAASHVQYKTATYSGSGDAVCQIDGEPATYPPGCWTASSPYWAMFVSRGGGAWNISGLGVSSQTFRDGDAEGFRYESQSQSSAPPSPAGVCPPPATPTAAPARTAAPPSPHATSAGQSALAAPVARPASAPATALDSPQPASSASASPSTSPALAAPTSGRKPPPPASLGTGILAAAGLAAALILVLGSQVLRPRRHRPGAEPQQ